MNAFTGAIEAPTRRVAPSHRPWEPWRYQTRAVAFLMGHSAAALFLDPGLGKTSIVLAAFQALKERGHAERMLVVAPLRVCQLVWRQEGQKWTQFRDLAVSLLHGPKKADRLKDDADVHLINPEGIPWLMQQFFGRRLPWDTVCLDELTKFKNHRAVRSKKLRKALNKVQRRWGLTGSPAPNGYMDLFGQMLMLDDGAALGRHITHYRDTYFQPTFNGYDWTLRSGMAERIEERIAPYVLRMAAADYLELPPVRDNIIQIELPPEALRKYKEMERDMILSLPEGVVTGANSGAVYSKLSQMANGAVYLSDPEQNGKPFVEVHDAKLSALEELIEELSGQPLLVGYEFQHDLERIRGRLGADTPTLSGLSEKQITELEAAWNRGEIPVLLAHPASVAHGLNLQGSAAAHVCWFSRPWDLELYDQFIRRIRRQGTEAKQIVNHCLHVRGTMDDLKAEALGEKDTTQQRLLARLNAEILRDEPAFTAAPRAAQSEETNMTVRKLGFQGGQQLAAPAQAAPPQAEGAQPVRPRGWGAPAEATQEAPPAESARRAPAQAEEAPRPRGWGPPAGTEPDPQRAEIREKISAPPPEEPTGADEDEEVPASVRALQAFPAGIVQALEGDEDEPAQQPTAATAEEPVQPKGWSAPAAHVWEGISTRYQNALKEAGYANPAVAYVAGKAHLIANVDRFGEKGWAELEAIFGKEDDRPASHGVGEKPQAEKQQSEGGMATLAALAGTVDAPAGWSSGEAGGAAQLRGGVAQTMPYVRINIEVSGLDRRALRDLFLGLADAHNED